MSCLHFFNNTKVGEPTICDMYAIVMSSRISKHVCHKYIPDNSIVVGQKLSRACVVFVCFDMLILNKTYLILS